MARCHTLLHDPGSPRARFLPGSTPLPYRCRIHPWGDRYHRFQPIGCWGERLELFYTYHASAHTVVDTALFEEWLTPRVAALLNWTTSCFAPQVIQSRLYFYRTRVLAGRSNKG